MRNQNAKGLIKIIMFIFVIIMFVLTLYACLDIFEIVDIPAQYSLANWLNENFGNSYEIEYAISNSVEDGTQTITKRYVPHNETESEPVVVILPNDDNWNNFEVNKKQRDNSNNDDNTNNNTNNQNQNQFWYYNQLDEYAKIIYKELEKNLDNMKSGTYNVQFGKDFNDLLHEDNGEETLTNSFQLAINALNFDNPEIFYIDISKVYLLTKITQRIWGTTYEVEIGSSQGQSYLNDSFANSNDVDNAIREIEQEKENIKSRLGSNINDQIKTVHDYLVNNLEYDTTLSNSNIYNIYGALISKSTVCEGYARAFKSIMDDLGIPCLIACGTGVNSFGEIETHAWNYINLDDNWYAIDVTWDDPVIIGNGYISNDVFYKYYLKGSTEFFKNHTEDGAIVDGAHFVYPTLSRTDY